MSSRAYNIESVNLLLYMSSMEPLVLVHREAPGGRVLYMNVKEGKDLREFTGRSC